MRSTRAVIIAAFSLLGLLLTAGTASAAPAATEAPSDLVWSADPEQLPGEFTTQQVWGACGTSDANSKLVRSFTRYRLTTENGHYLAGGTSNLVCGSSQYGYRHISSNRIAQWQQMAAYTGENWRDVADLSISSALNDPDTGWYRGSNDTFNFQRVIFLIDRNTGQTALQQNVCVSVATDSKNIITSYPGACSRVN